MNEPMNTNDVFIQGEITSVPKIRYNRNEENFYEFELSVKRQSEIVDKFLVIMSERTFKNIRDEEFITVTGELRTRNFRDENGKSHLEIYIFARDGLMNINKEYSNEVNLTGYVCKPPIFRVTPFHKDICDLLIAVNRINGKRADYIPSIVWGRNASYAGGFVVGDKISVQGRFQSRTYSKRRRDGSEEEKTAYELSIATLSKVEKEYDI